jgi:hypothetical protein
MEKSRQSRFMQKYKINSRINNLILLHCIDRAINACILKAHSHSGTPELGGGRRGSRPRCPLPGGARGGAKIPFQFKGLPWRNSEFSEIVDR